MARFARVIVPECAHHVTQRGNARRDVFYTSLDKSVYLGLLKQYSDHYALRILGYVLMTNHVHLVAVPSFHDSLAKTLREVNGRYARYRNAVDRASGHVWQSRYYSCAVEEVALASVMRYVELNPVRARMVQSASDYAWSSAIIHLGGPDALGLIAVQEWSEGWSAEDWAEVLRDGEDQAAKIREATYSGRPLGGQGFITAVEARLSRRIARGKPGRPKKPRALASGVEM